MKYLLLKAKPDKLNNNNATLLSDNYEVVIKRLNPFNTGFKGLMSNIFWAVISKGCWIAFLKDKNKNTIVSYSYVIGKSFKFPFMGKRDLQIGPAFTIPELRGRGLFSLLLSNIIQFFETKNYFLIALVRPDNYPSLRCFKKNGFYIDDECKKNKLKIYRLIRK